MISATDVEFYRTHGYLVVENVLDADTLARVRGSVDEILAGARGVAQHTAVYDLEPNHQPDAPQVRRIKTPHVHFPFFHELARFSPMVGILKHLLGPGVRLHGSKINMKAPRYGSAVEWHQDWAFYPHTNDDLLAVGVMLDDCTRAMARCWCCPARTGAQCMIIMPTECSAVRSIRPRPRSTLRPPFR